MFSGSKSSTQKRQPPLHIRSSKPPKKKDFSLPFFQKGMPTMDIRKLHKSLSFKSAPQVKKEGGFLLAPLVIFLPTAVVTMLITTLTFGVAYQIESHQEKCRDKSFKYAQAFSDLHIKLIEDNQTVKTLDRLYSSLKAGKAANLSKWFPAVGLSLEAARRLIWVTYQSIATKRNLLEFKIQGLKVKWHFEQSLKRHSTPYQQTEFLIYRKPKTAPTAFFDKQKLNYFWIYHLKETSLHFIFTNHYTLRSKILTNTWKKDLQCGHIISALNQKVSIKPKREAYSLNSFFYQE
jgi:hypothetical protein